MRPVPALSPLELRVAIAAIAIYAIFDRAAAWLGSTRGEWGVVVALLVLALVVAAERAFTRAPASALPRSLGLTVPTRYALLLATALSLLLLAFLPSFAHAIGSPVELIPDWPALAIGIVAQGGIAEEVLFRGFLYRHLRARRSFWRAAVFAAVPFVAAHLVLFATLDFAIAFAAVFVSLSLSVPLARLFDLAGCSIWPGVLLHAVIQGAIKLVVTESPGDLLPVALVWMVASALLPWTVFLLRRPSRRSPAIVRPG